MHHFGLTNFLIDKATFLTPSSLGSCLPNQPAFSLPPLASGLRTDQENTTSRIARFHAVHSGFFYVFMLAFASLPAFVSLPLRAETLTIATAANFQQTLKALHKPFADASTDTFTIVSGSSGALANQIISGAPFDVFLSADARRPRQLVEKGFAIENTLTIYAYGRLTLWSNNKALITNNDGPTTLKSGNFRHIAYANPALAPYGLAAVETLRALNLFFDLSEKTIRGENIAQTFTMLATGAAPIGFIARSQLSRAPWKSTGSHWHVPANFHQPIRQAGVIVKNGKKKRAAERFMTFLKSEKAARIIKSFGYDTASK